MHVMHVYDLRSLSFPVNNYSYLAKYCSELFGI